MGSNLYIVVEAGIWHLPGVGSNLFKVGNGIRLISSVDTYYIPFEVKGSLRLLPISLVTSYLFKVGNDVRLLPSVGT